MHKRYLWYRSCILMWSERAVPVWSPGYSKQKATETCQVFTKEETLQDPENIVALQPASIFFFISMPETSCTCLKIHHYKESFSETLSSCQKMEGQRSCSATADDGLLERSSTHLHDNYQPEFHISTDLKSVSEWPRFTIRLLGFMNGFTSILDRDATVKR